MRYLIGLEDLAANGFIESLKRGNKRFFTFEELENYGLQVIKVLNNSGKWGVLVLSRDNTENVFCSYSDFFERKELNGKEGVLLRNEKTLDDLIEKFRGYLHLDVLLAFLDESCVKILCI